MPQQGIPSESGVSRDFVGNLSFPGFFMLTLFKGNISIFFEYEIIRT